MIISVASGKGGTGQAPAAVSSALSLSRIQFLLVRVAGHYRKDLRRMFERITRLAGAQR